MTKRHLLAALGSVLLVGGCMGGTENRGLESVHQPVVSRADYAIDLATAGSGLAAGENQRLTGWLDAMRLGFGDRVGVDDPSYQSPRARGEVAGIVAAHGLLLSEEPPVASSPVTPGTIRVIVSRMTARVPGCPDWSRDMSNEFEGNASSNLGCATNSNLAAMVASPEDLVRGRSGTGVVDTASSAKAIEAYRKAAPTGNGNTVSAVSTKGN